LPGVRVAATMIWEGRPEEHLEGGWPEGWMKRLYQRSSGNSAGHTDRYWYTPKGRKFRSMVQVRNFLEHMKQFDNDEDLAWKNGGAAALKRKPPPDAEGAPPAKRIKTSVGAATGTGASSGDTPKKPRKPRTPKQPPNTITVFSSIPTIFGALQQANPNIPLVEIQDESSFFLFNMDPTLLKRKSLDQLARAEILVTEPIVLAKLLESPRVKLPKLRWCQCTFAGVDPLFPLKLAPPPTPRKLEATATAATPAATPNDKDTEGNDKETPVQAAAAAPATTTPGEKDKEQATPSAEATPVAEPAEPPAPTVPSFTLTRLGGCFGPPIAEWCLGRIIAHERNFELSHKDQKKRQWAGSQEVLRYRYLSQLTLTILGCGDIGMHIARAAQSFRMNVVGYVKSPVNSGSYRKTLPYVNEHVTCLQTAIKRADYIVSVLPSTPETQGLLDMQVLSHCSEEQGGKCPVLINVGRGDVISDTTLIEALNQDYLSAAILDVLEQEPLPTDNPLWRHPQITISPHVSGLTRGQDVPGLVLHNYTRYLNGQSLLYVVDWNKTY